MSYAIRHEISVKQPTPLMDGAVDARTWVSCVNFAAMRCSPSRVVSRLRAKLLTACHTCGGHSSMNVNLLRDASRQAIIQ